jgi:hypothetical protein
MKNVWKFLKFNQYQFESDENKLIVVKFNNLSRQIVVKSKDGVDLFKVKHVGMFRSSLIVNDNKDQELIKLEAKRWWKSQWQGQFKNQNIEIKIVNRPWVEYILMVDGVEALAYGLKPFSGKAVLAIQQFIPLQKHVDYFHVLLFSLIRPVLMESMGNQINMDVLD